MKPDSSWISVFDRKPEIGQLVEVDLGWVCQCRYDGLWVMEVDDDLVPLACPLYWRPVTPGRWKPVLEMGPFSH